MRSIIFLLFIVFLGTAFSQSERDRKFIQKLCSEEFHGRGYYKKGDSIAADFIATAFEEAGLKKIGSSYLQHFNFDVNRFPGKVELQSEKMQPGVDFIVDAASPSYNGRVFSNRFSVETLLHEETLAKELQKLLSKDKSLGEQCVLLDFKGVGEDTLQQLNGVEKALANYLPVIKIVDEKFTWSVARSQLKYPVILIQREAVEKFALDNFTIQIEAELVQDYQSQNVIARLPGTSKRCKKTVVFTAHYDHLGRMGHDALFPGANDNASGTTMLLSLANYFQKHPVKQDVVFIAFGGEEAGLIGSKYFVEHPLFSLEDIKFLLNIDIMGSGEEGITAVNATLFEKEFKKLQKLNEKQNYLQQVKAREPAANSDHYWFTEKDVPCFFIYTMGLNKHYHDVYDTYEELSFEEYEDIILLLADFVGKL